MPEAVVGLDQDTVIEVNPGELDIDALNDIDLIDKAIAYHKTRLYEKTKFHSQINQAKKDAAAAYREQLTEIKEEVDFEINQIDALIDKSKIINAQGSNSS